MLRRRPARRRAVAPEPARPSAAASADELSRRAKAAWAALGPLAGRASAASADRDEASGLTAGMRWQDVLALWQALSAV